MPSVIASKRGAADSTTRTIEEAMLSASQVHLLRNRGRRQSKIYYRYRLHECPRSKWSRAGAETNARCFQMSRAVGTRVASPKLFSNNNQTDRDRT